MYRIYGKEVGAKRFKPMDLKEGRLVTNLIYATLLDTEEYAKQITDELNTENAGVYVFQYRSVKGA